MQEKLINFRENLGNFLTIRGISQMEASDKLGISQQAVSLLVNGDKPVRPSTIRKVFTAFPEFEDYLYGNGDDIPMTELQIIEYIEKHEQDFVKVPQFLKMVMRISQEHGIFMQLLKEMEDLKSQMRNIGHS